MQYLFGIVTSRARFYLFVLFGLGLFFLPAAQAAIASPLATVAPSSQACSLATLNGTYLFHAQGVIADADEVQPYAEAGTWTLDGAGNAEGIYSAGLGGQTIANRQPFTATYEVVSGCAFAAFAPIGDEIFEFHLFTTPSGAMVTYYSDGFSGTMWRHDTPDNAQAELIENALSAAPHSIAGGATVVDWPAEGNSGFPELRAGTNGWTCLPDDPSSPTNDPMCLDEQWMEWLTAIIEGRDPEITTFGWAYMLQGGSGASDTDPSLMAPAEGEDWLIAPPHLMLIGPDALNGEHFPTHRDSGEPYIMWAGTPYEHFMIPVQIGIPPVSDDPIANALSAAPELISAEATVMDWPTENNPDFTELRAGTNNWTCLPNDPISPTNDPMCLDDQWMEWLTAQIEGREPEITELGFAYMLQGGSGASDADPSVMEPAEGEDWLVGPPHVMLISPNPLDADLFPTQRGSGEPYIMWAGTPYEHFMAPSEDLGDE